MNTVRYLFLTVLLAFSAPAWSVDTAEGWYVGAGAGMAWLENDELDSNVDDEDFAWKLIVGWQATSWLGFEGSYYDFGSGEEGSDEFEADGYAAFAVVGLPLGPFRLFAKGGGIAWDSTTKTQFERPDNPNGSPRPPVSIEDDEDGTDLAVGVGAELELLGLGVRAEVEYFDFADDVLAATLGLTYSF